MDFTGYFTKFDDEGILEAIACHSDGYKTMEEAISDASLMSPEQHFQILTIEDVSVIENLITIYPYNDEEASKVIKFVYKRK